MKYLEFDTLENLRIATGLINQAHKLLDHILIFQKDTYDINIAKSLIKEANEIMEGVKT